MVIAVSFLIVLASLFLVANYRNKHSIFFAAMSLSIAFCAFSLIIQIRRYSIYTPLQIYTFRWLGTDFIAAVNNFMPLTLSRVLIIENIGVVLFQLTSVFSLYFCSRFEKHNGFKKKQIVRLLMTVSLILSSFYFIFFSPGVGLQIFLAQYRINMPIGDLIVSVSRWVFLILTLFVYIIPLFPIAYLLYAYRKNNLTIFLRQFLELILTLSLFNILFFIIIAPYTKSWNEVLRTGFWLNLSRVVLPPQNLVLIPIILTGLLFFLFFLMISFKVRSFDFFRESSIKKKLEIMPHNLQDALHSEKNIIFNLKILAEAALDEYGTPEGKQKLERLLEVNNAHMDFLNQGINAIKDTRVKTMKRDFIEAVETAMQSSSISNEIKVSKKFPSKGVFCNYDSYHIVQAIGNLLENASEALIGKQDAKIDITLEISDDWLLFSVWDNGKGIPVKKLREIFRPYFSMKGKLNNWGLGLSYVQKVIKAHFGYIRIKSEPEKWTKVEILLRRA